MSFKNADFCDGTASREYLPINPVNLPNIDRDAIAVGPEEGVYADAGKAVREFWRNAPAFVDDPDTVELFSQPELGRALYRSPPSFIAAVGDALLIGYRTVITRRRQFFTDEAYVDPGHFRTQLERLSRRDPFSNEETGLRPTGRADHFRLERNDRPLRQIKGTAVFLGSDEPLSYGSFLFRVLPKVKMMRQMGLIGETCIAYAHQKPYRDLLNLAGVPDESIVLHDLGALTRVGRVLVPCLRNPDAYIDPESYDLFSELRELYGGKQRGRKVYVSRLGHNHQGWSTRIMANEADLVVRLRAMDFDIIEPERLSVKEQIAAFASAGLIVGPSGSGMFNTVFCRPGTKVIDLQSERHWIYSYAGMYASLQLEYGFYIGKSDPADTNPVHRRWTVNIDPLISRIEHFLKQ